ncbi:MAG: hypothetical protein M3Y39_13660 [Chloroflexota bacterium]|nr:hypothetical protein [Chloroflexota bacterium]
MVEDLQDDVPESTNTVENQQLKLKWEIEEKKLHYKIERRPLAWFFALLLIVGIIITLSSLAMYLFGDNSFIGGWGIFIVVASSIIFIGMAIYFLVDYRAHIPQKG